MFHESMTQDPDPVATVTWTPPLYPDTVEMGTGHTREAELAQLRIELQVKCMELAALEDERAVTVLELEQARARVLDLERLNNSTHDLKEAYKAGWIEWSGKAFRLRRLFKCANKAKRGYRKEAQALGQYTRRMDFEGL